MTVLHNKAIPSDFRHSGSKLGGNHTRGPISINRRFEFPSAEELVGTKLVEAKEVEIEGLGEEFSRGGGLLEDDKLLECTRRRFLERGLVR